MNNFHLLSGIIGITGMGKSFWVKNSLLNAISKFQPVIVFDKDSEYAGENARDIPKGSNWVHYGSIHSFMVAVHKAGELSQKVHVISCNSINDFDYGIKLIYAMELPVCTVIEEAHFIFDEPKLKEVQGVLKNIARFGRKKNMSLALISQRFLDIPKDIRTQFRGVVSFHQNDFNDVQSLIKFDSDAPKKIVDFKPREFEIFGELPKQLINEL